MLRARRPGRLEFSVREWLGRTAATISRNNDECTAGLFCGGVRTHCDTTRGPWCGYSPLPSRGAFDPHRRLAAGMPEHVWVDLLDQTWLRHRHARGVWRSPTCAWTTTLRQKHKSEARLMLRLPQCWFNPRCRGGEHTAEEAWSCNRSLGSD